jgi:hypothetical protein
MIQEQVLYVRSYLKLVFNKLKVMGATTFILFYACLKNLVQKAFMEASMLLIIQRTLFQTFY